jgi:hypothetical protein
MLVLGAGSVHIYLRLSKHCRFSNSLEVFFSSPSFELCRRLGAADRTRGGVLLHLPSQTNLGIWYLTSHVKG